MMELPALSALRVTLNIMALVSASVRPLPSEVWKTSSVSVVLLTAFHVQTSRTAQSAHPLPSSLTTLATNNVLFLVIYSKKALPAAA